MSKNTNQSTGYETGNATNLAALPIPLSNTEFRLGPQDELPDHIVEEFNKLNKQKLSHEDYKRGLEKIFGWKEDPSWHTDKDVHLYLMGFIDGEGSLHVSLKKSIASVPGVGFAAGFNITQTADQAKPLFLALCVFGAGRLRLKNKSRATLMYEAGNRQTIYTKVLPFLNTYLPLYSPQSHIERYNDYLELLELIMNKGLSNKNTLLTKMLPLWDKLRRQKGQKNQVFGSLAEATAYVQQHFRDDKRK